MTGNWTLRAAASAGLAVALALVVTGCGTPNSAPTTGSASASTSTTPSTSPRPTGTTTAVPIEGQCDTANLTGTIGKGGGGAAGSVEVTIVLTNNGSTECSLQGWPGVSFVGDGNGTQLGKPADFDRSTPHPTVVLQPGGTAQAPLRITQALNYPEADCKPQPADGFRVYPPGSKESLFIKYDGATACTTDTVSLLQVGALVGS
ncbi:DUF4232 domain-containing protein [Leifsonia shinshuensis]|uniref:DUF4232 domain-containing protein n=1 Tax=Leifsonia shinshuensis TaxID=150026 RepID=UPI00286583F8|nr:DUF4232 domain-containing protein [Leifsonia shinshuensis]MDR6971357.1 hypothetical protein [Leifsonia shinshuensis]